MKSKSIKKIAVGILSIFLAFTCFFGVAMTSVSAADSSSVSSAIVSKTDYKTKKNRPTYTGISERLEKYEKKENKAFVFVKEGKDIANDIFDIIQKSSSESDADWTKVGVNLAKDIVIGLAACVGLGDLVGGVMNGIEKLFTSGEEPLSEVAVLTDEMHQEFNKQSDQLYDIETKIGSLSNEVKQTVNEILDGTNEQFNNFDAKLMMRAFMTSGEGNFSYDRFQEYLYGSSEKDNYAYYNKLIRAIVEGADDETIQDFYNKLFDSLYSNLDTFEDYYFGKGYDKSIAKYYYDYLSANESLVKEGKTAESMAVQFAYELYSTYVYSYEVIKLCYIYQISEMRAELNGAQLDINSRYKYNDSDYIYYKLDIQPKLEELEKKFYITEAKEMAASDLAYILQMKDSYIAVDPNGEIHDIGNNGSSFGNVSNSQQIYLNRLTDELIDLFDLDVNQFSFEIYNGNTCVERNVYGIIKKDTYSSGTFSAKAKYGSSVLYTIPFTFISEETTSVSAFSGGSGTYDDPYLISHKKQFSLIEEMNACYKLISNINFDGKEIYPIGTYNNPFNGIFDGNGYTISNISVNSSSSDEKNIMLTPTTGLFGTIGSVGIVKNVTLSNLSVSSEFEKDEVAPEKEISQFYIGGIAGYNFGQIFNCSIKNNASVFVKREKTTEHSRSVEVYVGGIAGKNAKTISYCTVECTTGRLLIEADSTLFYGNESIDQNKNTLQVGGIAGETRGTLSNCKVIGNVDIIAQASSTANSSDEEKPYVTVLVGGITTAKKATDCTLKNIKFEATDLCNNLKAEAIVDNMGEYGKGNHRYSYDNVTKKSESYCTVKEGDPTISNDDSFDTNLSVSPHAVVITSEREIEINTPYLATNHLIFEVNGEKVEATVIGYYGFDSYNTDSGTKQNDVEILFSTEINGERTILLGEVPLTIQADELLSIETDGIKTEYEKDSTAESIFDDGGFRIICHYAHGDEVCYISSIDDIGISDFDTSEIKEFSFKITYREMQTTQTAKVRCEHDFAEETIPANCSELGYDEYTCKVCNYTFKKNYTKGDHHYVVDEEIEATCLEPGRTQIVKCDICGETFREGEWIQSLPHDYITIDDAKEENNKNNHNWEFDNKYSSDNYHYCINGQHYEAHQYVVMESTIDGVFAYTYTCCVCNYTRKPIRDENIKTNDDITTITVSNGYALEGSDSVNVYVYLDNNKGFYGASFGVRYSDGLKLLSYSEGTLNKNIMLSASHEVYLGYNFIWANTEKIMGDGTLLKLTFATPEDAKIGDCYDVSIVYGLMTDDNGKEREGGFCITLSNSPDNTKMFTTYSGKIFVVDHLPGDVYEDGVVDEMDALWLSWDLIGKTYQDSDGNSVKVSIKEKYADVNLNGKVDIQDIILILQSVSGDYGTNLLYPNYTLKLNLNIPTDVKDFDSSNIAEEYLLHFYDGDNKINSWDSGLTDLNGNEVSFDEIKSKMEAKGYTFAGWYGTLFGEDFRYGESVYDTKIDTFDKISYIPFQRQQTLYARWEKNKVSFNLNDETSSTIEYDSNNFIVSLPTPECSYNVQYIVDEEGYNSGNTYTIYRNFEGWYNGDDEVESIDLSTPNLGAVELKAKWSDFVLLELPKETREIGYKDIVDWYYDSWYGKKIDIENITEYTVKITEDSFNKIANNGFLLYGKSNYLVYEIEYKDVKDASAIQSYPTQFTIVQEILINKLRDVAGYDFINWTSDNGEAVERINKNNLESLLNNGKIILRANWKNHVSQITIKGIDESSFANNTYSEKVIITIYYKYNDGYYSEVQCNNKLDKFDYKCYSNFEIKGAFIESIKNNGRSDATITDKNGKEIKIMNDDDTFIDSGRIKADGTFDEDEDEEKKFKQDETLYAYCCPKKITVTLEEEYYDGATNGSTISDVGTFQSYYRDGSKITGDMIQKPNSRKYYEFNGYNYIDTKGNSIQYIDREGKCTVSLFNSLTEDITLRAQWTRKTDYKDYVFISSENYTDVAGREVYTMEKIRDNTSANYLLISDIDCEGKVWDPISSFSGTIDGDGHGISNMKIWSVKNTNDYESGFICYLSGAIKNLEINNFQIGVSGEHKKINVGIIAGYSTGTIENCRVINCKIESKVEARDEKYKGQEFFSNVGGICGVQRRGLIDRCFIDRINLYSESMVAYNELMAMARVGGVVGYAADTTISHCMATNAVKMRAYAKATKGWAGTNNAKSATAYAGNLVGQLQYESKATSISYCVVYNNQGLSAVAEGDHENKYGFGYVIGETSNTSPTALVCFEVNGEANCWPSGTNPEYPNTQKVTDAFTYSNLVKICSGYKKYGCWMSGEDGTLQLDFSYRETQANG